MLLILVYALAKSGASRPDVKFYCDISYDPFLLLQKENKVYGEQRLLRVSLNWDLILFYRFHDIALWVPIYYRFSMDYSKRSVLLL